MQQKLIALSEIVAIWLVTFLVFYLSQSKVNFNFDESQWIATSYYLEGIGKQYLSVPNYPNKKIWIIRYWTLTQPPMARYIIALGRLSGGYKVNDLNTTWKFEQDFKSNAQLGNLPSPRLIWWSRLPMIILAATSGTILFFITKNTIGRLSSYIFLYTFVNLDYFIVTLTRAMGEAPLLFFIVLGILASQQILRLWAAQTNSKGKNRQNLYLWTILMGVSTGLAGASKLNGLVVICAELLMFQLMYSHKNNLDNHKKYQLLQNMAMLSVLSSITTFIIVNPFLHSNPIEKTLLMISTRVYEMVNQISTFPASSISGIIQRLSIVPQRIFQDYSLINFPNSIFLNISLFIIGIMNIIKYKNDNNSFSNLIFWVTASIPGLFTPLDWDRYYLFSVIFVSIYISNGIAVIIKYCAKKLPLLLTSSWFL